jgi:hypothetical protein
MPEMNFQWKCRRCETLYLGLASLKSDARDILRSAIGELRPIRPIAPQLLEVHSCKDGGFGIADLIGATPTDV